MSDTSLVKISDKNLRKTFLKTFGWNESFEACWASLESADLLPGRVVGQEKTHYRVQLSLDLILPGTLFGKDRQTPEAVGSLASPLIPAVGDWVSVQPDPHEMKCKIQSVLSRSNVVQRTRPGRDERVQVMAANVDSVFIVTSANEDFEILRLERFVNAAKESGAKPVLVISKWDLVADEEPFLLALHKTFPNIETHFISQKSPQSLEWLNTHFGEGRTTLLVGSSGVGKSSLVNFLVGQEIQKTQETSNDSKGRHTTTSRDLVRTRFDGLVIDTPGMRDILSNEMENETVDFSDIENLILSCKFSDCGHLTEPGCAIQRDLKSGDLPRARWQAYREFLQPAAKSKNPRRRV